MEIEFAIEIKEKGDDGFASFLVHESYHREDGTPVTRTWDNFFRIATSILSGCKKGKFTIELKKKSYYLVIGETRVEIGSYSRVRCVNYT